MELTDDDMRENWTLKKFITMEMMIGILSFSFVSGGAWIALNNKAQATELKTQAMAVIQQDMQASIGQIETDVAVIKANQSAIERRSARQEHTMDRILDILQEGRAH